MHKVTRYTLLLSAFLFLPDIVFAQDKVPVRVGGHADYARVVFDWPEAVHYSVARAGDTALTVTFDRAVALDLGGVAAGGNIFVKGVTQKDDKTASIQISTGSSYRDFAVGRRVIIDVLSAQPTASNAKTTAPKAEQPPQEKKAETAKREDKQDKAVTSQAKAEPVKPAKKETAVKSKAPDVSGPAVKAVKTESVEKTPLEQSIPAIQPHVATLSVTEDVGMAAFIRNNVLWVVLDRPNVLAAPEISGPAPNIFQPFTRHEIKGGVAFRMELPQETALDVYGEGGGLIWRLVLTPQARDVVPAPVERSFLKNQSVRGGILSWSMKGMRKVLDVPDPDVGDVLKVVTMDTAGQFSGAQRDFVDFSVLPSIVGIAVRPGADDLQVGLTPGGVEVSRPGGLALSRIKDVSRRLIRQEVAEATIEQIEGKEGQTPLRRIYDFDRWMMGGLQPLDQNQRILMSGMSVKDKQGRVQDLLTLAKMDVANDRGPEALGFLSYASQELPAIMDSPEFMALRGAAYALSGKYELALEDLKSPRLADYTELNYWKAYTLAWLEDWQQAKEVMPTDYALLVSYPKGLLEKMGLKLAEVALRNGDVSTTEAVLAVLQRDRSTLQPWTIANMDYLKGEAHRQSGENDSAIKIWSELSKGSDDLYRTKADLARTMLELQTGKIKTDEAIDRLEGLRYTWRGDELEAQINFMLGKLYIENRRFLKGFGILREAAGLSPDSDVGHDITTYMADSFKNLLMSDKDITPLDSVTVYEEFSELTPPGDEGNKLAQRLAEKLVEADLLGRASNILQHQVDFRVDGEEEARVALRLATIYLLDDNAEKSVSAIDTAESFYSKKGNDVETQAILRRITLLRARALSKMNKTEEALALLSKFEPAPDVNRLRADIAWQAGLWEDAAEALQDLILDQALDLNRPLTQKQADLILNRAVALNLSGNRVALANMRKRFEDPMKKTARAKLFDVVTRPRQSTMLADRQTLEAIVAEVDIFKEFLESYKNEDVSN